MRVSLIALSAFSVFATLSFAQADDLTADRCQPLSDSNRAMCCSASNWKDVVLPDEQLSCSQSDNQAKDEQQVVPGDTTGSVTPPTDGGGTTGGGVTSGDQSGAANPGNANAVGGSGEKGMDGESPSTGTNGNSN